MSRRKIDTLLDRFSASVPNTGMDLQLSLHSSGNITPRELAGLTAELRDVLSRERSVAAVALVHEAAPDGAKGIAETLGALLVSLAPGALRGALDIVKAVLSRAPGPPVQVEIAAGSVKLSFDPRRITAAEMADLVTKVGAVAASR
jgi:hypothetical protein